MPSWTFPLYRNITNQCDTLCSADKGKHRKAEGRGVESFVRIAMREVPGKWPSRKGEDGMCLEDMTPFVEYATHLESLLRLMH